MPYLDNIPDDRSKLIYNGIDLREYGLYVSGDKTFNSPKKEYTKVSIPGRSGDLVIFDGRYSNVMLEYDAILIENYEENAAQIRSILLSVDGYCCIEDCYHPNEYRHGFFEGPLDFDSVFLEAGSCTLQFNCKPYRFLKSGAASRQLNASSYTISNPTRFSSKPLFEIAPSGSDVTVTCNGVEFTIASRDYTVYVDSESMDCYSVTPSSETTESGGTLTTGIWQDSSGYVHIRPENPAAMPTPFEKKTLRNNIITISGEDFPKLIPGDNTISTSSYSLIKMTPRWYIL